MYPIYRKSSRYWYRLEVTGSNVCRGQAGRKMWLGQLEDFGNAALSRGGKHTAVGDCYSQV